MAYAELLGIDGGGEGAGVPSCDAGLPPGAPSTECACANRVVPGDTGDSYLLDVLFNQLPANCLHEPLMPVAPDGGWSSLPACSSFLLVQWVTSGAAP